MSFMSKSETFWNTTRGLLIVGAILLGILTYVKVEAFGHSLDFHVHHDDPHQEEQRANHARERLRDHEESSSWWYDNVGRDYDQQVSDHWDMDHMN